MPYKRVRLKEGAVPSIFPDYPSYLSKPTKTRKKPKERVFASPGASNMQVHEAESNHQSQQDVEMDTSGSQETLDNKSFIDKIIEGHCNIKIPVGWHLISGAGYKNYVGFVEYYTKRTDSGEFNAYVRKHVILRYIDSRYEMKFYINDKKVQLEGVADTLGAVDMESELSRVLNLFSTAQICSGVTVKADDSRFFEDLLRTDSAGVWRNPYCAVVCQEKQCRLCCKSQKTIAMRKYRDKIRIKLQRTNRVTKYGGQGNVTMLRRKLRKTYARLLRAEKTIKRIKKLLDDAQETIEKLNAETVAEKLKKLQPNIPKNQFTVIEEIINGAKRKSSKGNRYTEDWLLLCMLMHIRSPALYNMMRNNDILPLPCSRTISNYFALIDTKCGFDPKFLKLFKKYMSRKTGIQKDGILLVDEVAVREAIKVNTTTLTFQGLSDMGEEGPKATSLDEKANHGLVVMFAPLADTYTQPIGVFASRGTVKSKELCKIVLKAICLVEKCGARVHGIVTDGASTNKGMWTELGLSGKLDETCNSFQHPLDEDRKVFMISDTPHIMKCIRNRLFEKSLRVSIFYKIIFKSVTTILN